MSRTTSAPANRPFRTPRLPASLVALLAAALLAGAAACDRTEADGASGSSDVPRAASAEGASAPAGGGAADPSRRRAGADVSGLGHDAGSVRAPIRVVEFSDFGCGYCRRFHVETYPTLHEEYVETGLVRWKYVPFTLGRFPNGEEAATAGECAIEQDRFPELRDRLFHDQRAWAGSDEPVDVLVRLAAAEGLDEERFRACLEEGDEAADRVRENGAAARAIGIRGTPTFFVDGHPLQGAQPVHVFRQILDRMLELRTSGAGGGPGLDGPGAGGPS